MDYLFVKLSGGRIAKREFHSIRESEQMIEELPEGDTDAGLEKQLEAARERARTGTRIVATGINETKRKLLSLTDKVPFLMGLVEAAAGVKEGALLREAETAARQAELKRFWLAEQEDLREQFKQQEAGERLAAKEESRLKAFAKAEAVKAARAAAAAGIKAVRKRRKTSNA